MRYQAFLLFTLFATVPLLEATETKIAIGMRPGKMRYKVESFTVKPGATVKLTLKNNDELQHNLIVCGKGADTSKTVNDLAMKLGADGLAKGFVPDSPLVLAATKMLNPHESQTIEFKAPNEEGIYPYVCTFPGHAQLMKGQMIVTDTPAGMTDLRYDYYEGSWHKLPDFSTLKPVASGKLEKNLITITPRKRNDQFGFVYRANLGIPVGGIYKFHLNSDDGSRLYIADKLVVDNDGVHGDGNIVTGIVKLSKGSPNLRVEFFEQGGGEVLKVAWSGPGFKNRPLSEGAADMLPNSEEFELGVTNTPRVVRCRLPDTDARSIAVGLPNGLNYVFETTTCMVKYGWIGEFIDVGPERGNGRGGGVCRILGKRFETRPNHSEKEVEYLGYRSDTSEPTFIYRVGSKTAYLTVQPDISGTFAYHISETAPEPGPAKLTISEPAASSPASPPRLIPAGYKVETITPPEEITFGVAGLGIATNGDVYAGTRFGQVWKLSDKRWSLFAEGLHEITGIYCDPRTGQVFASHKPELTELIDLNEDGSADFYRKVTDDWGFLGNYHQYAYGPVRDRQGNFYGTLNLGHGGGLSVVGVTIKKKAPRRGTCYRVLKDGYYETFAWGLRSPAGIGINPANDEIFYTDNQGDWNATSSLHHVVRDHFYGHPASLAYHPNYKDRDLNKMSSESYAKMRTLPVAWIPQGELANSPGNPVFDTTGGKFGPFQGQIFVGDQTRSNIFRVALEKVGGAYQGCAINMIDHLQSGAIRLAFAPDGSLWVGQTSRGWGSVGGAPFGLQKITFDGSSKPCEIQMVRLTRDGFDLLFTKPVSKKAAEPGSYRVRHWGYDYHGKYGSRKVDETEAVVESVTLSADAMKASLRIPNLKTNQVYRIQLGSFDGADETPITGRVAYYTLNRLKG